MKNNNNNNSTFSTWTLKIKEDYFLDILAGYKKFEIRKKEHNYKVGDTIIFSPITFNKKLKEIANKKHYKITYILNNFEGLTKDYIVFTIKEEDI